MRDFPQTYGVEVGSFPLPSVGKRHDVPQLPNRSFPGTTPLGFPFHRLLPLVPRERTLNLDLLLLLTLIIAHADRSSGRL